jgi:hypothetical protein
MKSIATVLATAPSYDLTTLATAREELGATRRMTPSCGGGSLTLRRRWWTISDGR